MLFRVPLIFIVAMVTGLHVSVPKDEHLLKWTDFKDKIVGKRWLGIYSFYDLPEIFSTSKVLVSWAIDDNGHVDRTLNARQNLHCVAMTAKFTHKMEDVAKFHIYSQGPPTPLYGMRMVSSMSSLAWMVFLQMARALIPLPVTSETESNMVQNKNRTDRVLSWNPDKYHFHSICLGQENADETCDKLINTLMVPSGTLEGHQGDLDLTGLPWGEIVQFMETVYGRRFDDNLLPTVEWLWHGKECPE